MSGGEPELWLKTHYSHRNKAIFGYASEDDQAKAAADLAICQKAMGDAFATYPSIIWAYYNMRRDHKNWILAGGIDEARKGVEVDYQPPYAEKPSKPKPAIAQPKAVEAPAKLLPDAPSIDADLDAEFAESPEDRTRRIEWIKYYVREGDLQKAFDLGWDGKPFRQDKVVKSPSGSAGSDAGSDDTPCWKSVCGRGGRRRHQRRREAGYASHLRGEEDNSTTANRRGALVCMERGVLLERV